MTDPVPPAVTGHEIATVAAASDGSLNPRTGEPRRPWSAWVATVLLYLGVAAVVAGLLWTWWLSVDRWDEASWLHPWISDAAGERSRGEIAWIRAGLAVGEFAVTLLIGAASLIAGYYGWRGYRWTRWAGCVAAVLGFAALLLNPVAWAGIPPVVLGAVALWLPPTGRFFRRWDAVRHPEPTYPEIADRVAYGPLPRYQET